MNVRLHYIDITEADYENLTDKTGAYRITEKVERFMCGELIIETVIVHKVNGQFHRADGPAITSDSGKKIWWFNGKLHREDGPAIEDEEHEEWYLNGVCHRLGGPCFTRYDLSKISKEFSIRKILQKSWCVNGDYHRIDGPAVELADGSRRWYRNGQLHREDGPAVESAKGYKRWYLFGKMVPKKDMPYIQRQSMQRALQSIPITAPSNALRRAL